MIFRRSFLRLRRLPRPRLALLVVVSVCVSSLLLFAALPASKWQYGPLHFLDDVWRSSRRMPVAKAQTPLADRVACNGPRGRFLAHSPDDELRSVDLGIREL